MINDIDAIVVVDARVQQSDVTAYSVSGGKLKMIRHQRGTGLTTPWKDAATSKAEILKKNKKKNVLVVVEIDDDELRALVAKENKRIDDFVKGVAKRSNP